MESSVSPNLLDERRPQATVSKNQTVVFASRSQCVLGSRVVTSEELSRPFTDLTGQDAVNKTGIASRRWVDAENGETLLSLARQAVENLLGKLGAVPKIEAVLCSSTSPVGSSPTVSCQLIESIPAESRSDSLHAFDFSAACSGYLYGLRMSRNELSTIAAGQDGAVLLVTAEVLSPFVNPNDMTTAFLFGDAATATLITKEPLVGESMQISSVVCKSTPDTQLVLKGPSFRSTSSYLEMDGLAVARQANKDMAAAMHLSANQEGLSMDDFDLMIPHPGSKRILQSVARRLQLDPAKVLHTLETTGNTSSSSIPIALDRFWDQIPANNPIGMFAFGAGFTSAAAVGRKKIIEGKNDSAK